MSASGSISYRPQQPIIGCTTKCQQWFSSGMKPNQVNLPGESFQIIPGVVSVFDRGISLSSRTRTKGCCGSIPNLNTGLEA